MMGEAEKRLEILVDLINNKKSVVDILKNQEVLECFQEVKHLKGSIRKFLKRRGYVINGDYFEKEEKEVEVEMIVEHKKEVVHHREEKEIAVSFEEDDYFILKKLVGDYDKIKKLLNKEEKGSNIDDIISTELPEKYQEHKTVAKSIRVNELVYKEFQEILERNSNFKGMSKTQSMSIVFHDFVERFKG